MSYANNLHYPQATFKIGIKTLIYRIFVWNSIHEVKSIITFEFSDNYSGVQLNSTCNVESAQKRKMHVELARLDLQHFSSHNSFAECFTEKKKQTTFPSSYGVLLQQREQEPLVCYRNTYQLRYPSVYATDSWMPVSQFILAPGQLAPRGTSQPRLACPPGSKLSRDILPPALVILTPGGASCPGRFILPPRPYKENFVVWCLLLSATLQ